MILKSLIEDVFIFQIDIWSNKTDGKKYPNTIAIFITSTEITIGSCCCVSGAGSVASWSISRTFINFDRRTFASWSTSDTVSTDSTTVSLSLSTWHLAFWRTWKIAPVRHLKIICKNLMIKMSRKCNSFKQLTFCTGEGLTPTILVFHIEWVNCFVIICVKQINSFDGQGFLQSQEEIDFHERVVID